MNEYKDGRVTVTEHADAYEVVIDIYRHGDILVNGVVHYFIDRNTGRILPGRTRFEKVSIDKAIEMETDEGRERMLNEFRSRFKSGLIWVDTQRDAIEMTVRPDPAGTETLRYLIDRKTGRVIPR